MVRTAFLLSAGMGKRLRPLTHRVPKPLLPVRNDPILIHVMRHCRSIGIQRFIINIHHRPEAFDMAFPDREWEGLPIEFVYEETRLETGTGLKNIQPLTGDEPLLVYNSDILCDFPLEPLVREHLKDPTRLATLAATPRGDQPHLIVDENHRLLGVDRHPPSPPSNGPDRMHFLGISLIHPPFFEYLRENEPESVIHGWNRAVEKKPGSIHTFPVLKGRWCDIGTIETYESVRVNGLKSRYAFASE